MTLSCPPPLYFTETWRFAPEDRAPVKELISIYKAHRNELYEGYVFSLGDRPDDTTWTGFQNYHPNKGFGYMTLFREIENKESKRSMQLRFLKSKKIVVENLITGEKETLSVDEDGFAEFKMPEPASFKFYKYSIL